MATFQLPARRLIVAGGFAFAIVVAPALGLAAPTAHLAPRPIAQTACDNGETMDPVTLQCVPPNTGGTSSGNFVAPAPVAGGGAPSEGQLTDTNPGVASPGHR